MSDSLSRFVQVAVEHAPQFVGDVGEVAARAAGNTSDPAPRSSTPNPVRKKKLPNLGTPETTAVSKAAPTPAEIQASLNKELADYVDALPTPEKRSIALIKIGSIKVELQKYAPLLEHADEETAQELVTEFMAGGDQELRKMVWNAVSGTEDLPLAKTAPAMLPGEDVLNKMVQDAPNDQARAAVLQKMGIYTSQLRHIFNAALSSSASEEDLNKAIDTWLQNGDRSHQEMKKAIVDAERAAMQQAAAALGEKDLVQQRVGNASTHVDNEMGSDAPDSGIRRTVPKRPTGEGAGSHMAGNLKIPGQDDHESPRPGSGPNDTGDGGVQPETHIRRKGATGGLGSSKGAESGAGRHVDEQQDRGARGDGKKKKSLREMDKIELLAPELIKLAPDDCIEAISDMEAEDVVEVGIELATHAQDLMAWSDQAGDQLQKRDIDARVAEWLEEDPDLVPIKKWAAEALATAEEIPLDLAKAIMAWQPVTQNRTVGIRVRQPA